MEISWEIPLYQIGWEYFPVIYNTNIHYSSPPPFPLSPSGSFALENHTPVQWKDGFGPPVVPGGPGHRHQQVAEEVAKKGA